MHPPRFVKVRFDDRSAVFRTSDHIYTSKNTNLLVSRGVRGVVNILNEILVWLVTGTATWNMALGLSGYSNVEDFNS